MKSSNYTKRMNSIHETIAVRSSNFKVLNIGAVSELVVLLIIVGAEATPLLLNGDSLQARSSLLINFYIFGITFLLHLALFFLKNTTRALILKTGLRVGFWLCVIANLVENQVIGNIIEDIHDLSDDKEIAEMINDYEKTAVYSYLGIYLLVVIQQLSFNNETLKRVLACITLLYFSIRVSINIKDPIPSVYGVLLSIVILIFYSLRVKYSPYLLKTDARADGEFNILKQLLSDTNEGFLVLRSDLSIYHANQRFYTLLDANPEDPVPNLEFIRRFDTLPQADQLQIKSQIFESLTSAEKILEDPFRHTISLIHDQGEKSNGSFDSPYTDFPNKMQTVSGFHPSSRTTEKFSPVHRGRMQTNDFSPQFFRSNTPKAAGQGNRSKSLFRSLVSQRTPKSPDPNKRRSSFTPLCNFTSCDDQTTKNNNSYNLDMGSLSHKKSGLESSQQKSKTYNGEYIFKDGLMKHFERLARPSKIEHTLSLESSLSSERRGPNFQVSECVGFITDPETGFRLLSIKTYPFSFKNKMLYAVNIKDITEKEHYNVIRTADKDKDHKLSSVTHELRTPLNCIITMLGMLEKAVSYQLIEDYIKPASHSAKLLLSLINDILDHSQSKAKSLKLTYSYFNLKQNLIDILKLMRLQAKAKGLELNFDFEDKGPKRVYSEPNRLRQIVINLIGNALKFTLKGSITLKVEYMDNNVYRISVRDTGIGIKPENLSGLFEKFTKVMETSRLNHQGIGLGLSISNSLAKMLGSGTQGITVTSTYGLGTTFSFDLESKVAMAMNESDHDFSSDDEGSGGLSRNFTESGQPMENSQAQKPKIFQRHVLSGQVLKPDPPDPKADFTRISSYARTFTGDKEEASMSQIHLKIGNNFLAGDNHAKGAKRYSFINLLPIPSPSVAGSSKYNSTLALPKSVNTLQSVDDKIVLQEPRAASLKSKNMLEESMFIDKIEKKISIRTPDRIIRYNEEVPILVVEDNVFNIMTLEKILDKFNIKFDSATNGKVAIDKILERKEEIVRDNYKLILMDCNMPIKDGFETTKEIRALEAQNVIAKTPIIAVTASTLESEIKKCYDSGMDDYVAKPITFDIMRDLIAKYLKGTE